MLSFVYPAFLIGLAALAVPVFLHLMNRAIPVRLVFPSIRFIRKAHLPREGRRRVQDILVLILRLLLLIALVLAFARPEWRRPAPAVDAIGKRGAETVIVADVSASMQGWSGVDLARKRVADLLAAARNEDVGLVFSSNRPVLSLAPGESRAKLREAVNGMTAGNLAGEHLPALNEAIRLFHGTGRRRLVIVSDFQQTDWQLATFPKVTPGTEVQLVDVNPDRADNVGITGAVVSPLAGGALRVVAEVRNFGHSQVTRKIHLRAGGEQLQQDLVLPPLQVRRTVFVLAKPEVSQGELLLDEDVYPGDDTYRLWLGKFPPVRLLAVTPVKQEPQTANEFFFLRKAIGVKDEASPVEFAIDTVEPEFLFALNLDDVRALILLGAAGYFQEQEFNLLKTFLSKGGVVLCTPGSTTSHQFFGLRQSGLLPVEYLGLAGEHGRGDQIFSLAWVNPAGLLGRTFDDVETTDLYLFPIYRYARMRLLDSSTQVLLRMAGDDPALVERSLGNGRLFVCSFAFSPQWSDFPMTGSFLPLVRDLLSTAIPENFGVRRLECGQPVPVPHNLLGKDDGARQQALAAGSTATPGVFLIGDVPCEVNVSRRESVVEKVNLFDLQAQLAGRSAVATVESAATEAQAREGDRVLTLWPHCAMAAALLVLLELAFAAFLDHRELAGRKGE